MRTDVTFTSDGLLIAGHLHTPDEPTAGQRPAIVVGHPAAGVKEQAAGQYARQLAERGFITLAFDAAHQGESAGLPRGLEDPAQRIEDIRAAVSALSVRNEVDPDRIGLLGICASGGYAVPAAATDPRIKAVATVSATDVGQQFRDGPDGNQDPSVAQGMLAAAAAARTAEAGGAEPATFPIFPADEQTAKAAGQHVFDGWQYYCTDRARHPRAAKEFTWNSVDRILAFDAFRLIDQIAPRPLLMVVGTDALTRHMTTDAFERAAEPKRLHWVKDAGHVDLYDLATTPVVEVLADFFGRL